MRPDAIPVQPLASFATLPKRWAADLFGTALSGSERIGIARHGADPLYLSVRPGERARLVLSAMDLDAVGSALRFVGPLGSAAAPAPEPLASRLDLPEGLRRAWNVPAYATVALGGIAVAVPVADGDAAVLFAEPTLWMAAGQPETGRWLPGVDLAVPEVSPAARDRFDEVDGRVVTETAVRQARLRGRQIRLRPEQIVTPGAW